MAKKGLKKSVKSSAGNMVKPASAVRPVEPAEVKAPCQCETTVATTAAVSNPAGVPVHFALLNPDARQVWLAGEFNGWSTNAVALTRKQGELWETTVPLKPGRYQYKFVVDGEWVPDPAARENISNPHGTLNSIIEVRE